MPPEAVVDAKPAALAAPVAPAAAPAISGYIDAAKGLKVSGWAWNRADPTAVLEIEIRCGGEVAGRGRADKFRADLEKAGVGDGRHAFEVMLETPIAPGEGHAIEAFALCPGLASPAPLVNRTVALPGSERGGAPAMPEDFRQWVDQVASVQRSFEVTLRAVIDDVRAAEARAASRPSAELQALTATVDSVHGAVAAIAHQLRGLEVFQARFDGIAAALEQADAQRLQAVPTDQRLVAAVAGVAALSLLSLVMGIWAIL
ncbi:MAG: hypothetical protein P9C36_02980 [Defluviicoccus sp.]|nr:hypothetical protein [Defluviicoccus sp.]MDG4591572.1 hypothetical protein [Defluviicoccus sp.]MDS4011232.1 hypothetical protein [Defluviicoccus sp.]